MPRKTAYKTKKRSKNRKTKSFSWKKSGIRNKSGFKSFFSGFLIFTVSLMFLSGVYFYKSITKPLASANSITSQDILTKENTAVVFIEVSDLNDDAINVQKINVLIYDKNTSQIVNIKLPLTVEVDVPGKYGEEPLDRVLALGTSISNDNVERGTDLLKGTLENVLAFNIDYFVLVNSQNAAHALGSLTTGSVKDTGFLVKDALLNQQSDSLRTDMSLNELNSYRDFAASLEADGYKEVNLSDINEAEIDKVLADITYDSLVALEKKSVAVLNGTNTSGLALYGSRVVKNIGGRVIAVENTRKAYDSTILVVDDKSSETVKELVNYFNIDTVLLKSEASSISENEISRSDITLILGFDTGNNM